MLFALFAPIAMLTTGCGTTTHRLATEQLLMSDAVDHAIAKIDFSHLEGSKVYLDTIYLQSVKGNNLVNSEYVISSLRQQLTAARCYVQDNRDDATIIVEPRVGTLGIDGHEVVYGIPQSGAVNSAASVLAKTPFVTVPEISVGKNHQQAGIAKVIVFAYDRETHAPIWQSGIAKAESTAKDTWVLGAGPFQKGSVYNGVRFAGKKFEPSITPLPMHQQLEFVEDETKLDGIVPFGEEYSFALPTDSDAEEMSPLPSPPDSNRTTQQGHVKPTIHDPHVGATSYEEDANAK